MPEAYIRGNTIKYLRVPDEVIDKVRDDSYNRAGDTRLALKLCILSDPQSGSLLGWQAAAGPMGRFACREATHRKHQR